MISIAAIFGFLGVMVLLDQLIKYAVTLYLQPVLVFELIPGVFRLRYVENTGAIFGSFSSSTLILTVFSALLVGATLYLLITKRVTSKYVFFCLLMMASGGVGNLVDRIRLGYVVDFLEPTFINFAVFNFADCLITVGAVMLIVYLIRDTVMEMKKNKTVLPAKNDE